MCWATYWRTKNRHTVRWVLLKLLLKLAVSFLPGCLAIFSAHLDKCRFPIATYQMMWCMMHIRLIRLCTQTLQRTADWSPIQTFGRYCIKSGIAIWSRWTQTQSAFCTGWCKQVSCLLWNWWLHFAHIVQVCYAWHSIAWCKHTSSFARKLFSFVMRWYAADTGEYMPEAWMHSNRKQCGALCANQSSQFRGHHRSLLLSAWHACVIVLVLLDDPYDTDLEDAPSWASGAAWQPHSLSRPSKWHWCNCLSCQRSCWHASTCSFTSTWQCQSEIWFWIVFALFYCFQCCWPLFLILSCSVLPLDWVVQF